MQRIVNRIFRLPRISESIAKRLRASYVILIVLMLIPVVVSLITMVSYATRYHSVIQQIERVSSLKPIVQNEIPDEMWSIVAGRKTFADGDQYRKIIYVNDEIRALMQSAASVNPKELTVARRTMDTLREYIDRMGRQIAEGSMVAENENMLEEIRSVSELVAEMLEEYIAYEVKAAAETSNEMQSMLNMTLWMVSVLLLITIAFVVYAQKALAHSIHTPISRMETFAAALARGNLQARAPETEVTELVALTASLNSMAGRLQNLIDENKTEQENLKKSELRTLQAQIAPHFLYNTLDAIVWLAEANRTDEVINITRALSDFFRISLSDGRDWITLGEEIRHLQGYLTIQKIRYRDILDYSIDVPGELLETTILKLVIQPLVENSIYHGIKHRRGRGWVHVRAESKDGYLTVRVEDNGAGMTRERVREVMNGLNGIDGQTPSGYGLYNVNMRIQLYYNQPKGISIQSDGNTTCVTFTVPLRRMHV